jgi:predicted nucleotidyltransferase
MSAIHDFAREVAVRFQPEKILLFGSYAYGMPNADSDVDILVIMPTRNQHDQAVKIRWEIPASFPMDLIVRTPTNLQWRLAEGDSFHSEIMSKGKVLYEKDHKGALFIGRA